MQTILALAKLELRQQARSLIFWLVVLCNGFLALDGYYTSPNLWENLQWATDTVNLFSVLLLALLATMAARRTTRQRVGEIVDSTGSRSWQMIAGQWLGFVAITALLSLVIVAVITGRALRLGGSFDAGTLLLFWLTLYFPNMLLGATVGLATGTFLPSLFVSLPLTVGWWFVIGTMSSSGALARVLPGIWSEVIDFTATTPVVASGALGFFPFYRYLLNRLAQTGLILVLLAVMVLLFKRRRESRPGWQPIAVAIIALITLGSSIAGFTLDLQKASQGYLARWVPIGLDGEAAQVERDAWQARLAASPAVRALSYQLSLKIAPTEHALAGSVKMQVRNDGNQPLTELIFTLDDKMKVEDAAWQGQSVELTGSQGFGWRSLLLATPLAPGATGTLELTYSGEVWEWTTRWNQRVPVLMAFISEQGIFLPPHLCWYPVPGKQNVVPTLRAFTAMPDYAVDFQVALSGVELTTVTNLLPAADGKWEGRLPGLLIAAGDWVGLDTDNITLLHVKGHTLDEYATAMQTIYDLAVRYLERLPTDRITALTVPSWFYADVDSRTTQAFLLGDRKLNFDKRVGQALWQQQSILTNVLGCWYDTLAISADPDLMVVSDTRLAITSYLWSLYRETLPGQQGSLQQESEVRMTAKGAVIHPSTAMEQGQIYSDYSSNANDLWLKLEEARRDQGEEALRRLLQQMLPIARQDATPNASVKIQVNK